MTTSRDLHRRTTRIMATVMVLLGVAMVVSAVAHGGAGLTVGLVLGVLFVAAGAGRLYLASRTGG